MPSSSASSPSVRQLKRWRYYRGQKAGVEAGRARRGPAVDLRPGLHNIWPVTFLPRRTGGVRRSASRGQPDTDVMPEVEIRKPLPFAVQVTPAVADSQRNGPMPVAVP
jgi:hypothetical protein